MRGVEERCEKVQATSHTSTNDRPPSSVQRRNSGRCDPPSTFCDPPSILKLDRFLRNHWCSIGFVDDLEKAHCKLHYKPTHEFQERHLLADCFKTNGNQ